MKKNIINLSEENCLNNIEIIFKDELYKNEYILRKSFEDITIILKEKIIKYDIFSDKYNVSQLCVDLNQIELKNYKKLCELIVAVELETDLSLIKKKEWKDVMSRVKNKLHKDSYISPKINYNNLRVINYLLPKKERLEFVNKKQTNKTINTDVTKNSKILKLVLKMNNITFLKDKKDNVYISPEVKEFVYEKNENNFDESILDEYLL